MLPYDGSPGGNALGAQIDAARLRAHNETINSIDNEAERPQTPLQLVVYLISLAIFLFLMFY